MRILLAAGGTGGHLRPALAVADALRRLRPSVSLHFLTAGRPVAERFFAESGHAREPLFPGRDGAPRGTDIPAWWSAYRRARRLLRDFEPDVVAGFGGYPTAVAGFASLSGWLGPASALARLVLGRSGVRPRWVDGRPAVPPRHPPLVLFEQNARPGRAVRILARIATRVLVSHPEAQAALPARAPVLVCGNPLPLEFEKADEAPVEPEEFFLERGRPTLLVLGGSQGSRAVNRMVLAARPLLAASHPDVQILLVTGDGEYWSVVDELRGNPEPRTVAVPFETRMKQAYQLADVVVARAGGTTLAELAVVGRPMILVPYPHHRDGHQFANAGVFENVGAARVVREGGDAPQHLAREVGRWLEDAGARSSAAKRARGLGRPDAATRAAEIILAVAGAGVP